MLKEKIKSRSDTAVVFVEQTMGKGGLKLFADIELNYEELISMPF